MNTTIQSETVSADQNSGKGQYLAVYRYGTHEDSAAITRERAAYLLRAARSRRSENVVSKNQRHYVKDASLYLIPAPCPHVFTAIDIYAHKCIHCGAIRSS